MENINESVSAEDLEIAAISAVYNALKALDSGAQRRVLDYISGKLQIHRAVAAVESEATFRTQATVVAAGPADAPTMGEDESDDGISPVAKKWMRRNGLSSEGLAKMFSLGIDDIDLVARDVPGKAKKEKMRAVFLLKGVAAYLGTGAPRFTFQQAKEACVHYDAFDSANFATYIKSMASEISGTKETGYILTSHGLAAATEILKTGL